MVHHQDFKEKSTTGRYITSETLNLKWFQKLHPSHIEILGNSVKGKAISSITLGNGPKKILMWSQMHGNESTTTKAVLDMVNFLQSKEVLATSILSQCTLKIIPILNPDGAKAYTRVNANKVDLNRDAKERTQPESKLLRELFEAFQPHYCFNLHDQRTLFNAGRTDKPATVSFLSPASNKEREVTASRKIAMQLIVGMNQSLQTLIPQQVGRYDDGFNDNCIGDTFQMLGVPTILFEAGHFQGDYEREATRGYVFHALVQALDILVHDQIMDYDFNDYFEIPENEKLFFDVLIKNPNLVNPDLDKGQHLGIRFKEVLADKSIIFEPEIAERGELQEYFGHETLDCSVPNDLNQLSNRKKLLHLLQNVNK